MQNHFLKIQIYQIHDQIFVQIFSVSILFTFDTEFVGAFGDRGMEQVIALVKNAYRDKKLKQMIGTTVQITGYKKKHYGAFTGGEYGSL